MGPHQFMPRTIVTVSTYTLAWSRGGYDRPTVAFNEEVCLVLSSFFPFSIAGFISTLFRRLMIFLFFIPSLPSDDVEYSTLGR